MYEKQFKANGLISKRHTCTQDIMKIDCEITSASKQKSTGTRIERPSKKNSKENSEDIGANIKIN